MTFRVPLAQPFRVNMVTSRGTVAHEIEAVMTPALRKCDALVDTPRRDKADRCELYAGHSGVHEVISILCTARGQNGNLCTKDARHGHVHLFARKP